MRRPAFALVAAAATAVTCLVLFSGAAEASNAVAPGQAFTGRVNGSFSDAIVKVVCPGPSGAGRRGHPISGQELEVLSPLPPVRAGTKVSVGHTGTRGRAIVAHFADDPSVATTFHQYFAVQPIPTTLMLPCGGTGKVEFRPAPSSKTARSSLVSVSYANIAA